MRKESLTQEFIYDKNTVDITLRGNQYDQEDIDNNPNLTVAQVIHGRYNICLTTSDKVEEVMKELGTGFASAAPLLLSTLDRQSLEQSGVTQIHRQPYMDLRGQGVLIGFVDTGIDYTRDIFRHEDGSSKIQFIYDQSIMSTPPEGFVLGTEFTNQQINEALNSSDPYKIVPHKDEVGHGTFLASLAAGREVGDFIGAAPEADIIAVKVKKARPYYCNLYSIPEEEQNVYESTAVMLGIEYIIKKADELNRPVSICIGFGTDLGSHDGYSILEEYLSSISILRGICICTAAGNSCQDKHHMQGQIHKKNTSEIVDVKVDNDSKNVLLTLWSDISDRLSISIRSPTGELVSRIPAKPSIMVKIPLVLEKTIVQIQYYFPVEGSGGQLTVIRLLHVTPGIWTINVHGDIILNGNFHAWLPYAHLNHCHAEFLSPSPYCTVSIPGTMIGSICCGSYNHNTKSLSPNSSWGPTRSSFMAPTLVAPGVNVGGFYPTGYGTMSGTSVAMAITAGACALLLQWGYSEHHDNSLSTYQIRAYLVRGCDRMENMSYPNTKWGYGCLNIMQTFNLMRDL